MYSDHEPLTRFHTAKEIINKRYRWIEYLQELGTIVKYLPGKDNVVPDFITHNLKHERKLDVLRCSSLHLSQSILQNDEILAAQRNDPELTKIINYLQKKQVANKMDVSPIFRRHLDHLELKGNLLVYKCNVWSYCIVAPAEMNEQIIKLCHSDWASGHFGLYKSHRRILQRFRWPTCLDDLKNFIANCDICLKIKPQNRKYGALGVRKVPQKPLEIVSIDFLTHLPMAPQDNIHILVVVDWFSKYLQLYAVPNRTAETAAKCMRDYSLHFGIPLRILSDQDPAFEAKLFSELMRLPGLQKQRTSGYNPRSNGLVEQANRSVKTYLTSVLSQNNLIRNYWDRWLLEMAYSYNTSVHSTTNFTPAQLMFGRNLRIPIDILYGTVDEKYKHVSTETFAKQLSQMYAIACQNMGMKQMRYKTYYDQKVVDSKLQVNDLVYVYLPRLRNVKFVTKCIKLLRFYIPFI